MNIRNPREIRHTSGQVLAAAPGDPRKVVFIYGGIVCLLSLISTILSFILSNEIADTGGLSNLGMRSILSTIQTILPLVNTIVALGLELGYCRTMLDVIRGRSAQPRTLLNGFYRFWPMILAAIFQGLIYIGVLFVAMYLSSWIFTLLPSFENFYEIAQPMLESMTVPANNFYLDDATLYALMQAMLPMLYIFAIICCIALPPIVYQYRMVTFCLADSDYPRALAAMSESRRMMRGNRFSLFRLDLSFWWYYLLQVLAALLCYGDVLLPMVGITFPWSETFSYFLFLVLSLVLQLALYCCFMNRVTAAYAAVYEELRPKPQSGGVVLGNIFDM